MECFKITLDKFILTRNVKVSRSLHSHDIRQIFNQLKICAFRCSVHIEPPQPYQNLDA